MTVLLTSSTTGQTGLIMLLRVNASHQAGGVVSIPPQTVVRVPGHGWMPLQDATTVGGPSLLVETVCALTGVPVNHYAQIDFSHVGALVDAVHGVSVILPATTVSFGHVFLKGENHLDGIEALDYARQPSLSEDDRALRQQSLIRAVLDELANDRPLTSPLTMTRALNALTSMLTVDSDFTDAEIESLATELRGLSSRDGTFVTAPTETIDGSVVLNTAVSGQLRSAIRNDSIAAFAHRYPWTVTPLAP